jgi:hypothetical protein
VSTPAVQRPWIPPGGLIAGFAAHGLSWLLLFFLVSRQSFGVDLSALAWVHLVALGWLTMIALSVLVHVIPTFTEVPWKGETFARGALGLYGLGVALLVAAFLKSAVWALPWSATLVLLGLVAYLIPAAWTLTAAITGQDRVAAVVARVLSITLTSLLLAAALGVALAYALGGWLPLRLTTIGAPVHASLGVIGWLTTLVMGVSTRTVRPISGTRSRWAFAHRTAGALEFVGMVGFILGIALQAPAIVWAGFAVAFFGALVYIADVLDVLTRATVRHRPPQAFLAAGMLWLLAGLASLAAALAGFGSGAGAAAVYVLLVGWIGQMVNGHLYHIGIRLVATMVRGDEDETRPGELLNLPLSWISFGLFQIAVACGGLALVRSDAPLLRAAALCGFTAWVAMATNVVIAYRAASRGRTPRSRVTIDLLSLE